MIDPQVNFFSSTLVGTYSASDTSLTIATGSGELLPDPSVDGAFNLVIYNESAIGVVTTYDGGSTDTRQDLAGTNPEIVRVTARSGDVLTVTRGQEGTTASAKEEGNTYRVILSATKKIFDDIQTAIDNVNVTDLTGVESLVFDTTGDEEFGLPTGTTTQRPASPSAGYMRWNSTLSRIEVYNGTRWAGLSEIGLQQETLGVATATVTANDAVFLPLEVEYLVIAGGGGGGENAGAGGGAGGYRSSVSGENSGGGASAESVFEFELSTSYTVTVGAGGTGSGGNPNGGRFNGANGSNSVFTTITSTGGGGGCAGGSGPVTSDGEDGGSGGGATDYGGNPSGTGGAGTSGQGYAGGNASTGSNVIVSAGGGGAGGVGGNGPNGAGGAGVSSSITGSSVARASGGNGYNNSTPTTGGGGAYNVSGTANTGGGGGGDLGNGGSGVVILRYPSEYSISVGAGLTASTATVGVNKVTTFTAGTDTISFS